MNQAQNFPLHLSQLDVYMDQMINLESPYYNIGGYWKLLGKVEIEALRKSIASLSQLSDIYRMRFALGQTEPICYFEERHPQIILTELDFSNLDNPVAEAEKWMQNDFNSPFNLYKDRHLFRHTLLKITDDEHWLSLRYHHLITDGYGFANLGKTFSRIYKNWLAGDHTIVPLPLYKNEIINSRNYFQSSDYKKSLEYWIERIKNKPVDILRKNHITETGFRKKSETFILNIDESDRKVFEALEKDTRSNLQQLTIAAIMIYYAKTNGCLEFIFGVPIHRRGSRELRKVLGMLAGYLPFKGNYDADLLLSEFLNRIRISQKEDYRHQNVLLGDLKKHFKCGNGSGELFQIVVNYVLLDFDLDFGKDINAISYDFSSQYEPNPLNFWWRDYGKDQPLQLRIDFLLEYFDNTEVNFLAQRILYILKQFPHVLDKSIRNISILPPSELKLLGRFNAPAISRPQNETVIDLITKNALLHPSATAIIFNGEHVSYGELDRLSDKIARYLVSKGVGREIKVPVCMHRTPLMIIGLLSILKAGGAYIPVDPAYPKERIKHVIEETGAFLMITDNDNAGSLSAFLGNRISLIEIDKEKFDCPDEKINMGVIKGTDLAYIIYTSGSTGKPKGVMIQHDNLFEFVLWCQDEFSKSRFETVYAGTSICFDLSVFEIFFTLSIGKQIRLLKDGLSIAAHLQSDKNVLINSVPSVIQHLLQEGQSFKNCTVLNMAGEVIPDEISLQLNADLIEIRNLYGPSEDTTYSTIYRVRNGMPILIGKPISNTFVYILNNEMELQPIGCPGEIHIGGKGVALGYLNQPEQTELRFISDPVNWKNTDRIYRTGDLGRWLPDGNLEFLGRKDNQVKVKGYRIEIGEIESAILKYPNISKAVVLVRGEGIHRKLHGYIVAKSNFKKDELYIFLQERLPQYMLPSHFFELKEMPMTSTGKIDRNAIPEIQEADEITHEQELYINEVEEGLMNTMMRLLKVPGIGIRSNFFELGGDSIIAIQFSSRIKEEKGWNIEPHEIFRNPTIKQLAELVRRKGNDAEIYSEQGPAVGTMGLTPIQHYFLENGSPGRDHYNQSVILKISKDINIFSLTAALHNLVNRHDSLRLAFSFIDGQWQQQYGVNTALFSEENLVSADTGSFESEMLDCCNRYQSKISIENGPMLIAVLIYSPLHIEENRLLLVVHHLVVDGVSWRILLEDLAFFLQSEQSGTFIQPKPKTASFRKWWMVLMNYSTSTRLLCQRDYWERTLANHVSLNKRSNVNSSFSNFRRASQSFTLDAQSVKALLKDVSGAYNTEINDLLLTALAKSISDWSGQDRITIGLEGHGREPLDPHISLTNTVGWFTSLFPLFLQMPDNNDWSDIIKSIKEQIRKIPDKGIGYGVLKYLSNEPFSTNLDLEIIFNYLGQVDNVLSENKWISLSDESPGKLVGDNFKSKERLTINAIIQNGVLVVSFDYVENEFNNSEIRLIGDNYVNNLTGIIDHCKRVKAVNPTPSDFGLGNQLSYGDFDTLLQKLNKDQVGKGFFDRVFKLSSLQEGIMFHELYNPNNNTYVEQFTCDLGQIQIDIFQKAWDEVLKMHNSLRCSFYHDTFPVPVQCAFTGVTMPIEQIDLEEYDSNAQSHHIIELRDKDKNKKFDLSQPPLMRVTLIKLSQDKSKMIWTFHHILFDGWSIPIIIEDLLKAYDSFLENNHTHEIVEDNYGDYIKFIGESGLSEETAYWQNNLVGIEEGSALPFIDSNIINRSREAGLQASSIFVMDTEFSKELHLFVQKNGLTANSLVQGVWAYLLSAYIGKSDIVFGTTVSGRPGEISGIARKVGMFINTLPIRVKVDREMNLREWLGLIQENQAESRKHQYVPLSRIQSLPGISGELFDTSITFQNYPIDELVLKNNWKLQLSNIKMKAGTNYPLTIVFAGNRISEIEFTYNAKLINGAYVERIKSHFKHVLNQFIQKDFLYEVDLLPADEKEQLLVEFNKQTIGIDHQRTVVELFEEQVMKNPGSVAVVFEGQKLSFAQLDESAGKLAARLQSLGVVPNVPVAICIDSCIEMVIGIIGILKAGGAYVPIDTAYPEERIEYMLLKTGSKIILSGNSQMEMLQSICEVEDTEQLLNIINIQDEKSWEINKKYPFKPPLISPSDLSYIIFTSGSTGNPKGVMISHCNLVDYFTGIKQISGISTGWSFALVSSIATDLGNTSIYGSLLSGGQLHLFSRRDITDSARLDAYFNLHSIDCLKIVPSHWKALSSDGKFIIPARLLIFGGEALPVELTRQILSLGSSCQIINHYGPTETTIGKLAHLVDPEKYYSAATIPIGKPFSDSRVYILSSEKTLCPVGVPGELYIGGAGVSPGYINDPDLTKEKFIQEHFGDLFTDRKYRTGDCVRWLPDGNIEYLGRVDDQVKIRGYRIELQEIVSVLRKAPHVHHCIVLAIGELTNKQLVAYITPEPGKAGLEEIKTFLKIHLPEFMLPSRFIGLDKMPLTANGKINRTTLLELAAKQDLIKPAGNSFDNSTMEKLLMIWRQLLENDELNIHDNFFESGGDSLLAIRLISAVRKEMNASLYIGDIFDHPTIEELLPWLVFEQDSHGNEIMVCDRAQRIPLSFGQERIWFIDRMSGSIQYQKPFVYRLAGKVDIDYLNDSFKHLINRHEVLRTVILEDKAGIYQHIMQPDAWRIDEINMAGKSRDEIETLLQATLMKPFDLSADHMLRVLLIKQDISNYILVIGVHHIASDGWSGNIIMREISESYNALINGKVACLPELKLQYADFSHWQRKYFEQSILAAKTGYWKNKLAGLSPLNLPADFVRPAIQSTNGALVTSVIPSDLCNQLQLVARKEGVTVFMLLMSIFKVLLYRYCGQTDICIGTAISNRPDQALEGLIGFFVNSIAVRSNLENNPRFADFLQNVKETVLEAFENKDVPFEKVVEAVIAERDMSRSPVFQIMFSMDNTATSAEAYLDGIKMVEESVDNKTSQMDLVFNVKEKGEVLTISIEYCTDLFTAKTMERFAGHFINLLKSMLTDPAQTIDELEMMSLDEKHSILTQFSGHKTPIPTNRTILDDFKDQVEKDPGKTAVIRGGTTFSFGMIDELSNRLGHRLKHEGVKADVIVPVCVERSEQMLIGILAILKAGGAFLPIDPNYPASRIRYMIEDSSARIVVTDKVTHSSFETDESLKVVRVDSADILNESGDYLVNKVSGAHLAYVIYTSGSTGKPKGVMIEHKNLFNFSMAMDKAINLNNKDHLLATTSISFDISILELLWTLSRGVKITINEKSRSFVNLDVFAKEENPPTIDFSLFYFSSQDNADRKGKYDFLIDSVKFADKHKFAGVWLPERHFHQFGGIFPNPAVLGAALATITNSIEIRSGSVVLPLNDVIRVAEEWSVVDNLSNGRVSLSIASGWHANDFVLMPSNYTRRQEIMFNQIEELKSLWNGNSTKRGNGNGLEIDINIFPKPIQPDLTIWITSGGNPETFRNAGKIGANILTHLLGQEVSTLEKNISIYTTALRENGFDDKKAKVALMLHAYVGDNIEVVRSDVKEPFKAYLRSSIDLMKKLAIDLDVTDVESSMDELLEIAFDRYWQSSALMGTIESCAEMIHRITAIGVTEIACLVDFGIDESKVMKSLEHLNSLKKLFDKKRRERSKKKDAITMLQVTPTYLNTLLADVNSGKFIKELKHLIIGGERLPVALIKDLTDRTNASIYNFYGPTETTIWSTYKKITGNSVNAGRPLQNNWIYILDKRKNLCPVGVPGEVFIGGDGLARGYIKNHQLTQSKFISNPFVNNSDDRIYSTGDLGKWTTGGEIEILGRIDDQVKVRGFRIEPGEIEIVLRQCGGIIQCHVLAVNDLHGVPILVGYVKVDSNYDREKAFAFLKNELPDFMIPSLLIEIDNFPMTTNGKIDKNLLPVPTGKQSITFMAPRNSVEVKLTEIWRGILGRDKIGVMDNFFENGGHSLLAVRVASQILTEFNLEIPLKELFTRTTISQIAEYISINNFNPVTSKSEYHEITL